MESELRRILRRFSKTEMKGLLSRWGKIPTWNINFNTVQYQIVNKVLELALSHEVQLDDVHLLELLYIIDHPTKKVWKAHLLKTSLNLSLTDDHFQAWAFKRCLKQKLCVAFASNVQVSDHNSALWGRVSLPGSSSVLFFIHFPYSPFLLISKGAKKLLPVVTQALKGVLGYRAVEEMDLQSPHPQSLAQILLHNRDPRANYAFDNGCYKPQERFEPGNPRDFCDDRVKIEHMRELKATKKTVERQFGKYLQPRLQAVEITSETRFRGQKHLPGVDPSTTIRCRTRFVGKNVLEGIRKISLLDLSLPPLPRFLTNIAVTGQQRIKITDKQTNNSRHSA